MKPTFPGSILTLIIATTPLFSHADVYKCVNAVGGIVFQDKKCTNSSTEIILKDYKSARSSDKHNDNPSKNKNLIRLLEINNASKSDLQRILDSDVVAQILDERNKNQFRDWPDVINRVVGLSAAQTAVIASINGLTVNGKSLDGAPPDITMAAMIKNRHK